MKCIKIIQKLILIIVILQILGINVVYAQQADYINLNPDVNIKQTGFLEGIIQSADNWVEEGKNSENTTIKMSELSKMQNAMYNTLLAIGIAVSVIVGMVLGIKYMTSATEEQAKVKETLIVYVIGCIVVFGAFGIWKIAVGLFSQI